MRTTVSQLLANKGDDVWAVPSGATVYEALELMADKGIGALLVIDDDRLVGVMSERDYARKVILFERDSKHTTVAEIMTGEVHTVTPDNSVGECMALMTERRIRHLPVLADGQTVIGVISIGDVVKTVIHEQKFLIEQLEQYITS